MRFFSTSSSVVIVAVVVVVAAAAAVAASSYQHIDLRHQCTKNEAKAEKRIDAHREKERPIGGGRKIL